ncbi:spore cortex biosynthesis protein YabQ [Paenibacillus silvisoli]|uniref:spore cortex biosynthesis protein YabQ n=1 Tax=Paenibacillus silvisoli TaxID=3110539 RepID=UPI002804C6C7|nr:spore cortex biosynthesis protein YabQ [Paenibacillus silvisoli]
MSLSVQWLTMLSMLLSGIGMGIVFDGYRVVSDELRISRLWIPIFDLLYWIAATLVVFQVLSASNEGEVRAYVFIGLLLGIGCYYWLFSRITMKLVQVLIRTVKAVIRFMIRTFDVLIIRPLLLLYRIGKLFLAFLRAFAIFIFKIVVQLVRPFWLLTAWMTKPIWKPLLRYWERWVNPIIAKWRIPQRIAALRTGASKLWQRLKNRKEEKKDD